MSIPRIDSNQTFASNANNASSIQTFKTPSAFQASTLCSLEHASADAVKEAKSTEKPFYVRAYESVKNAFSTFWNWLTSLLCCCSSDPTLAQDIKTLEELSKRGFICLKAVLDDKHSATDFLNIFHSVPITVEKYTYDGIGLAALACYIKSNPDKFKNEVEPLKILSQYKASDLYKALTEKEVDNHLWRMASKVDASEVVEPLVEAAKIMCEAHPGFKKRLLATGNACVYFTTGNAGIHYVVSNDTWNCDKVWVKVRVALGGQPQNKKGSEAFLEAREKAERESTLDAFWRNK